MRAKGWILLVAAAAFLLGAASAASAAEKPGKPLNIKPSVQSSDNWRARAMKARAEFEPDGDSLRGNARAADERGDRKDGEEAGSGMLRHDRGEGGGKQD
jgi:Skp family chaperone for outer membrane proteins